MNDRLTQLRQEIRSFDAKAYLVNDILNVRYISGFSGSYGVLLITDTEAILLTDSRYTEQAAMETTGFTVELVAGGWIGAAKTAAEAHKIDSIAFDRCALKFDEWESLTSAMPSVRLIPVDDPVLRLRQVKDAAEIEAIREAVRITDAAYEAVSSIIAPGMTEKQVALEIDYAMSKSGADKPGFDTIVASGPRSALPHGKPTVRQISEGDLIVMDFGASYAGYNGDITRTVMFGDPDERQLEIYEVVLEAQTRAIAAIRPGVPGKEIDAIARDYIASRMYGEYFGHGLGHGLGLAVHDGNMLSRFADVILQEGMIVTVEPGIYLPGVGGVRTEDDVLVTAHGCEVLTSSPKTLKLG